jgi:hypothetical protein
MSADRALGRTIPDSVHNLPEVVFDFSEAQEVGCAVGKTEMPVRLLPELAFDLDSGGSVTILQLTLSLRSGSTREEVALDLFRLYAALNHLERSHGGSGLSPNDAAFDATVSGGELRVRFTPTERSAAPERLARLVRAINGTAGAPSDCDAIFGYRSIETCAAQVIQSAA